MENNNSENLITMIGFIKRMVSDEKTCWFQKLETHIAVDGIPMEECTTLILHIESDLPLGLNTETSCVAIEFEVVKSVTTDVQELFVKNFDMLYL